MTATRKHPSAATKRPSLDAIALLTADHKKIMDLFNRFEKLMKQEDADDERDGLVQRVCNDLRIHMQIEEEIFYPAARSVIDDDELMDEADVEHAGAKELIAQLEVMRPGDHLYDAKVIVLGGQLEHHIQEEEDEMFPHVKKAQVDTVALGEQMLERKLVLMAEMDPPNEDMGNSGGLQRNQQKSWGRRTTAASERN